MRILHNNLFKFYSDKARDVLNNRNFFESVYLTSLITLLAPILSFQSASDGTLLAVLLGNYLATFIFLICLSGIPILAYIFFELKYREYRFNYMRIVIGHLYNTDIKKREGAPTTYFELCDILIEMTLFSRDHIMIILRDLALYQEPDSPPQAIA